MSDFHDVIEKFEAAGINIRKAYWGHRQTPDCCNGPGNHIGTDGDLQFVIEIYGEHEAEVRAVAKVGDKIVVSVS